MVLAAEGSAPWRRGLPVELTPRLLDEDESSPAADDGGQRRAGRGDDSGECVEPAAAVVVVCDDPSLRASMLWLLSSAGYEVEACSHSDAVLDGDDLFDNACLLLDLRSSPAKGVALLDRLGRRAAFPPVILMTGYDEPLAVVRGLAGSGAAQSHSFDLGLLERVESAISAGMRARDRSRELAGLSHCLAQLSAEERLLLDEILANGEDSSRKSKSEGGGEAGAAPTPRARLLEKLGLRSWSRLAHLLLELEEGGRAWKSETSASR